MVRFETYPWSTQLQSGLDRDAVATMEVSVGEEIATVDESAGLTFGPYGASPISGLNFDTATDTAAS